MAAVNEAELVAEDFAGSDTGTEPVRVAGTSSNSPSSTSSAPIRVATTASSSLPVGDEATAGTAHRRRPRPAVR